MSVTFCCKEDKRRQKTVTKCIASKCTRIYDTHCIMCMQYLALQSILSGTLLVFYLLLVLPTTSILYKEINWELHYPPLTQPSSVNLTFVRLVL